MLPEMALGLFKCSCGPCENTASTTEHLLRSLPKFLFSGLCYEGSLNNNLFMRLHKDLLVFTVWPDTKRMGMKRQTVSALAPHSAVALEQLMAAFLLSTKSDPWLCQMQWKKQIGVCKELFLNMSGTYKELFFSFILSVGWGRASPATDYRSVLAPPALQNEETFPLASKRNSAEDINVGFICCLKWTTNTLKTIRLMGVWGWLSLQRGWKAFLS